ncbi:protein TolR [Agitococcus lubricus]|uniref:Tol-Pal system protein TolR n=1 Tax=Agitococcus lubricus TaxID=1077255 RepID=A0A2T5IWR0_9GAMM|nr:protein TolR [Agitococcus lubricus]PTQ88269.1 cell division and transport-associated protein TolR [Agitococcus lubricus]
MDTSPFQRQRRHLLAEMNVVPYIDVMLVLLVIFMITAPMLTQGLKVELPEVAAETLSVDSAEPFIVSIKADGSYWLKEGSADPIRLPLTALSERLMTSQQAQPQRQVLINGDKNVPYGDVVKLMSALQEAHILRVGLLTEPPTTP